MVPVCLSTGRLDFTTQTIPTALSEGFEDEFVRQTPFLRKVFYSVSEREDVSGFIENRNKVLKAREVLEEVIKSRDPSAIRDVRRRYKKELSVFGQIRAINSARNRILRKLRQIDANPNLSDDPEGKSHGTAAQQSRGPYPEGQQGYERGRHLGHLIRWQTYLSDFLDFRTRIQPAPHSLIMPPCNATASLLLFAMM